MLNCLFMLLFEKLLFSILYSLWRNMDLLGENTECRSWVKSCAEENRSTVKVDAENLSHCPLIWADVGEIIQFQECRAWKYRATQTFNPPYLREDTRCACSMRGHQTTVRSQGRFYFFQKNKTQLFRSQFTTKQNCHLVVAIWNLLLCSERNLSDEYAGFLEM